MPTPPPSKDDIATIGRRYGFALPDTELASITAIVAANVASYDRVEELYEQLREHPPQRDFSFPSEADNPLGAWYVRTRLAGAQTGPLAGKTVAIKDNIAIAGLPMMNGSRSVEGYTPSEDATVVRRVLDAGGTIIGKAVCEDLCFSGGSFTSASGPVRNPWDTSRMAGGSSSGCAALLAAGEVDLAIGGDQGGSVRIPASFTGTVAHKPTHGLVPYTGAFPIETTLDHLGPMTRTVADVALLLQVLAGDDGVDPRQARTPAPQDYVAALDAGVQGLRIGLVDEGLALCEPGVGASVRAAAESLSQAGAIVSTISVPWHLTALDIWTIISTDGATNQMIDGNAFGLNNFGRYDPALIAHYAQGREKHAAALPESIKMTVLTGRYSLDYGGGRHYAMARELVGRLIAAYDAALSTVDVLVMPTVPYVARPIPGPDAGREDQLTAASSMVPNTAPFDVSGHPATSVPAGLVDGLPAGMMIIGPRFDDARCVAVAAAYERLAGGFPRPA